MAKYINDLGDAYDEEELIQFANEQETTLDEIINRNELKKEGENQDIIIDEEDPKKKKAAAKKGARVAAKGTASKSAKVSSASQNNVFGETKPFNPLTENKIIVPGQIVPTQNAEKVAKSEIKNVLPYKENKNPIAIPNDWYVRKNKEWWQSPNLDDDEAAVVLKQLINSKNKDNNDFTISAPANFLENTVLIKSNKTGKEFLFDMDRVINKDVIPNQVDEAIGGQSTSMEALNNFIYANGSYTKSSKKEDAKYKKEVADYKATGLTKETALKNAGNNTLELWGIAKNMMSLPTAAIQSISTLSPDPFLSKGAEIVRLTRKAIDGGAVPLFNQNDSPEVKADKVIAVAKQVKVDVAKAVQIDIKNDPIFKENTLKKIASDGDEAQSWLDSFIIRNPKLLEAGLNEKLIKKYAIEQVAKINEDQNIARQEEEQNLLNTKDFDVELNRYKKSAYNTFDKSEKAIADQWNNVISLKETLYNLESKAKNSKDPNIAEQIYNTKAQIAASESLAKKMAAKGDEYNRYFWNPTTSKGAFVKDGKVDLGKENSIELTDKIASFKQIWAGTTTEKLANAFVKYNSQLESNTIELNKKQNVVIPKNRVGGWVSSMLANNNYDYKPLPNGDILIKNIPTKQLIELINPNNSETRAIGKEFFVGDTSGKVDIYSYDSKSNKRGTKIDASLKSLIETNADLKAKTVAINEMYLLNQSPTKRVKGFFGNVVEGIAKGINEDFVTSGEKIDIDKQVLADAGIKLSNKTELDLVPTFKSQVGFSAGVGIPLISKIVVAEMATQGLATAALGAETLAVFNALKNSEKISERAFFHITSAIKEEAKMQAIGLGPTSGAAFYTGGALLPSELKIFNAFKYRALNNISSLAYNSVKGAGLMEFAGITENMFHSVTRNEEFKDYINSEFDNFGDVTKRMIGNALAFSYMEIPKTMTGNFFMSGEQLERALKDSKTKYEEAYQALEQFKLQPDQGDKPKNEKEYKNDLKALNKDFDQAKSAYEVLSKAHIDYAYSEAIKTDEGLENLITQSNPKFMENYKNEFGHDLNIKIISGEKNSSFDEPVYNKDTNELETPGTIYINKDKINKGNITNTGVIAHELSHLVDAIEVNKKAKEYAESTIIKDGKETKPTPEDISLYKEQLEANKNKRIVDILAKNFPDLFNEKIYSIVNEETGLPENVGIIEGVTNEYKEIDPETGKISNPAEIQEEIVKRLIEELGRGKNLTNPLKARSLFKNLLNDFNNLIGRNKEINVEVKSANELLELLNDYAQSFKKGDKKSYQYAEAIANIDLGKLTDLEIGNAELNDPAAIARYNEIVVADKAIVDAYEGTKNTKQSKDIEDQVQKLYDLYGDNKIGIDELYAKIDALENPKQDIVTAPVIKESTQKAEKTKTVDEKKLGNEIDSFVGPKDSNGKYKMTKAEWDAGGVLKAKEKLIDGKMLDPLIKKELTRNGVSADNIFGTNIEIFIEDVKDRLLEAALLKFNPEINDSLGGFILGSQFGLKNKIGDVANRYKKQLSTSSIDVEAGGVGSVKELMSQEEADFEFEQEVDQGYKPKFKSLTDSKIVDKETLNTIKNKVIPIARTLKTRVDIKTSVNKSIEPIVREILNNMGSQVDIDIKTAMGGKKDNQLVNWLIKNKKAVLENATTTFLMGKSSATEVAGGIPEAVQKRVNGEWLSYPDYIGKKIDRTATTTDNRGNTSGDLMVRRTPDVANAVSDAAFVNRIIDPATGNPRRGAKEAVATEVAKQISLEAWRDDVLSGMQKYHDILEIEDISPEKRTPAENKKIEDLNNAIKTENPIFDAFRKNQEALGVVMADVQQSEIIRQFEQGSKKESKSIEDKQSDIDKIYDDAKFSLLDNINNFKGTDKQKEDYIKAVLEGFVISKARTVTTSASKIGLKTLGLIGKTNKDIFEKIIDPLQKSFNLPKDKQITFENRSILNSKGEKLRIPVYTTEIKYRFNDVKDIAQSHKDSAFKAVISDINYLENKYDTIYKGFKKDAKGELLNPNQKTELDKSIKKSLDIIFTDQLGHGRQAAKIGTGLEGKNLGPMIAEHNPPIEIAKDVVYKYLTNKEFRKNTDIEKYLSNTQVHYIPRDVANAMPKYDLPGKPRYKDPAVLEAWVKYIKANPKIKIVNPELMGWDTSKDFYDTLKAQESLIKSNTTSKESKNIADTNDAVTNSLTDKYSDEVKKIRVFDFDDTLGSTTNKVLYTMPDGTKGTLNGAEFAEKAGLFANDGAQFDFSDFANVREGVPGPLLSVAKAISQKRGTSDIFVLTARPADAAEPIQEFLRTFGLDIPLENITGLGDSRAQAKADWITAKAAEGYNDFYFVDDHLPNVKAVKDALDVLDVKGRVQQAKRKFSLDISDRFNKIIEENTGMENYKVFSDIVARRRGVKKNRFDFYVPPSAADFELLLYNFIGKGTQGEAQKKFFSDSLLKPYSNGNDLMDAARQSIKKDYKSLTDQFPDIKNKIEKLTPDGDYTYDQAIRVSMWTEEGVDIPGISQRDQIKLNDLVNNDPELTAFKQGLIATGRQGRGWVKPTEYWDASTIISDLHNLTEGEGRKKFLGEFIENYEKMFGTWDNGKLVGPNMNKIEAVYGTNVREALEDSLYRMTNGKNRSYGKDKETSMWSNWVNGSTGTIMFLNTRSAALQLIGAVNFLNLRDNNPIAAGKAFANQKQYWADFARIWNSDKMKERRGGLKEDVAAAEIANAAAGSKNKPNAIISYLLKIGYTPTQLADSFAIASGGAPFYRNRIKTYLKEGQSQAEAEANAWNDFTKVSDETQQSGDPRDISKQQASPAGRLLLTFQNTAMQQSRTVKKSFLDLKNGRGDAKTHVAKIIYYLGVQNLLFAGLQQGLFAVAFDDDDKQLDPEKKKEKAKTTDKKVAAVADGVLDTILRGTGFLGGIISVLKNMANKYLDEKDKDFKADYAKVVLEGANISPPIGSKLRKVYTGLQQTKFERDLIAERGWGVTQDGRVHLGPMYGVTGKMVEAGTNFPMDRLVNKIENVSQAMNSQNQAWQRIAVGFGFTPYSVGIEDTPGDKAIIEKAKEERAIEGKIKAKETRQRTKDSINALPMEERVRLIKEAALKRRANKIEEIKRRQAMNKY
jgi:hypothetical protein